MAAVAVGSPTMALEFNQSKDGSLMDAIFGANGSFTQAENNAVDLPRAASYNDFSTFHKTESDSASDHDTRDSSSIEDEKKSGRNAEAGASNEAAPAVRAEKERPQRNSLRKSLPKLTTSDKSVRRDDSPKAMTAPTLVTPTSAGSDDVPELPASNHLSAKLRRRSWMPGSRSPSPAKRTTRDGIVADTLGKATDAVRRSSPFRRSTDAEHKNTQRSRSSSLTRTISNRLTKRPASVLIEEEKPKPSQGLSTKPSYPSQLSKSFSTDRLTLSSFTSKTKGPATSLPRLNGKDKARPANMEMKKRDELWTAFRTLDAEFQKFQSKPTALKANVIRAALIPFLREYQDHLSTYDLRFEDLERRANILHKWWGGLLELILAKNNQTVSGTDRPTVFDAILGIMERPEWRLYPSPYAPLNKRSSGPGHKPTNSVSSVSTDSSETIMKESVVHNVRNLFEQNLVEQMGYVVEKMALRNAPASSVSFCGRTCAYAFFFCPGIADVLVRLWNPTMDSLNRVLQECGHKRSINLNDTAQRIIDHFPGHLAALKFNNISAMYKALRKPAPLPMRTHHLPWSAHPWVSRWCGKDSDLFYVFAKHFHMLVVDFLPSETTRTDRLCAPGLIFVHAQLLTNMDATIHRNALQHQQDNQNNSNNTFEDILADPDSQAPAFPLPPATNAARQMGENRLVMLVRDILSERNTNPDVVRQIFAVAYSDLLKAAARRTSIYNPNACYVLCDLIEESFLILVRYEQYGPEVGQILDWSFWMDVWRKIVESHNTTTEIRLYALLYSLWPAVVIEPHRKVELCSKFLLEPKFFTSRFNHWCPMVRAYYMRLLCWRVARFDDEVQPGDLEVLDSLSDCLNLQYSYYLYLRETAHNSPSLLPSTAPCNPAPGRRLLIVRIDATPNANRGAFMSFDGVLSPHPGNKRSSSAFADIAAIEHRPVSDSSTDSEPDIDEKGGKKWGLLRTIIGTSKQQEVAKSRSPVLKPADRPQPTSSPQRLGLKNNDSMSNLIEGEKPSFRPATFKFSLEWADRLDRRLQTPGPMRISPPRLPTPAQALLNSAPARMAAQSSPSPPSSMESQFADARSHNSDSNKSVENLPMEPKGEAKAQAKYSGRALAEWMLVVMECGSFFERRKSEGVAGNKSVETPSLGVESFKKPG